MQEVWNACERWVGTVSIRHESVLPHYHHFQLSMITIKGNQLCKIMWVAIVSETWTHRNKIVFRNWVVDSVEIFSLAQIRG